MPEPWTKDIVRQLMNHMNCHWEVVSKEWCNCDYHVEAYDIHIPPNKECPLCHSSIDNDHYHCGTCSKVSQIG